MAKPLKLIIFDLDGTLVNAYKAVASSVNFSFKQVGMAPLDDATIKRSVGWGDRHLLSLFVKPLLLDKIHKIYRRHHRQALLSGTKFMPGAKRLLNHLRRKKYRLAIASNRPTAYSLIILKRLQIRHLFDHVLCADKVKKGKPAPDILFHILRKSAVSAKEALYVGDMTIDVLAGKRAGIKTIAVATGSSKRKDIARLKPDAIISNIFELQGLIA